MTKPHLFERLRNTQYGEAQFIRFCIVGTVNTVVNFSAFQLLLILKAHYLFSSVTGFISGVIVSYFLNRRWTFGLRTKSTVSESVKFFFVNGVALAFNSITMLVCVEFFSLIKQIAWCIAIFVSLNVNFFGSKFWAFRTKSPIS